MLRLTEKRAGVLIWILENKDRRWSIYELKNKAGALDYSSTYNFVKELEKGGFLMRTEGNYALSNAPALVRFLSLTHSYKFKEKINFFVTGSMVANMDLISRNDLDYAFTLFSAAELLHPYVKTDDVHVYVKAEDFERWKKHLLENNARRAAEKEGNMTLIMVSEDYYFKGRIISKYEIAPIGVILADLYSYGGLGEEQADLIQKGWLDGRLYV